ncbi:MAG: hypothetical protein AAFV93_18825, partial [Chloroflexota bacterium]
MPNYYYSTQTFLAWCLNHYFYNQEHYIYCGAPFYPYKTTNPVSSNPYRIYGALYEPFKEQDNYNAWIARLRLSLQKGVQHRIKDKSLRNDLLDICDMIDISFFYPIVYRIDLDAIDEARLTVQNSGSEVNSNEYLIETLLESEFEILFQDYQHETSIDDPKIVAFAR